MAHEWIVVLAILLSFVVTGKFAWMIMGVAFSEKDNEGAALLMSCCVTAALAAITGGLGYGCFGLAGGGVGLVLGVFPGHWLLGQLMGLEEMNSWSTPSSRDTDRFFDGVMALGCAAVGGYVTEFLRPLPALAFATIGAPVVACLVIGLFVLTVILGMGVFWVALPRLGRKLGL